MKIAFAGDWHANARWGVHAIEYAASSGADIIVHLGDYGYEFTAQFRSQVERALTEAGLELWFVDGNHERFPKLLNYPLQPDGRRRVTGQVFHLPRGFRWEWDGVRFLALGGAYSIDRKWRVPHVSWWPEEEITHQQVADCIAGGPADVLVSHDCPTGVDIPGLSETAHLWPPLDLIRAENHRLQLRRVTDVVQPRWIWHGHYHRQYSATADLGYGPVEVRGLDMDGTSLAANVEVVDLDTLRAERDQP